MTNQIPNLADHADELRHAMDSVLLMDSVPEDIGFVLKSCDRLLGGDGTFQRKGKLLIDNLIAYDPQNNPPSSEAAKAIKAEMGVVPRPKRDAFSILYEWLKAVCDHTIVGAHS